MPRPSQEPRVAALIEQSLELAAERCADLTPLVYARLFREQPEMEALFWRDTNHAVKGEMLARVIEAILDFIGARRYANNLVRCEVITHDGYGVPPDVFGTFFRVVADTLADLLGADWSPEIAGAWDVLLDELDFYVRHPSQYEAADAT